MAGYRLVLAFALLASVTSVFAADPMSTAAEVRLKDVARISGTREHALIGYGLVVGLSGSGDSQRSRATVQSLVNTLSNFGVRIADSDVSSRNVAAVMVTAVLPAFAEPGAYVDVNVASTGDARSLAGGTLVLTPLYGPDENLYALAQGALSVGGHRVDAFMSSVQKNYPTAGSIPRGGTIERAAPEKNEGSQTVAIVLNSPDISTVRTVATQLRTVAGLKNVSVVHAGKVQFELDGSFDRYQVLASVEQLKVRPDAVARVVVSERTGTVAAGADVRLGAVNITHANLQVVIDTRFDVSQPTVIGRGGAGVTTAVVPQTRIEIKEEAGLPVHLAAGASVGDLVTALRAVKVSTRDVISILQAVKTAGALHAELVIQ